MQRLCGRPGCSEPATVAYGMRAEDLVFWLDVLAADADDSQGVLCRRHANTMVVPRGWTLDDLRDPDLHLFRPPEPQEEQKPTPHRSPRRPLVGEQLRLGVDEPDELDEPDHAEAPHRDAATAPSPDAAVGPWSPSFDEADDLDGLLSARGPLLSRAFRVADPDRE